MYKINRNLFISICLVMSLTACVRQEKKGTSDEIIGPKTLQLENDLLTAELLWNIGRVSDIQLSPDASEILFRVTWYNLDKNKGNHELYLMNSDGNNCRRITHTPFSEYEAR